MKIEIFIFIFLVVVSFSITKFVSGKKAGLIGIMPSLKIKVRKRRRKNLVFHIHHYMISFSLLLSLLIFNIHSMILFALLVGNFLQGVFYKDFYRIVYWEYIN